MYYVIFTVNGYKHRRIFHSLGYAMAFAGQKSGEVFEHTGAFVDGPALPGFKQRLAIAVQADDDALNCADAILMAKRVQCGELSVN